jgi:hypothetical protein
MELNALDANGIQTILFLFMNRLKYRLFQALYRQRSTYFEDMRQAKMQK